MKILVVEHSDHFGLLSQLDRVISKQHEVWYLFRVRFEDSYWSTIFQPERSVFALKHKHRSVREVAFFLSIFLRGFKVSRIVINTGPEYESATLTLLGLLAYFPHKRKLIYTVRNPAQLIQIRRTESLARFLRRRLLMISDRLIFENEAVSLKTNEIFSKCEKKRRTILYTYTLERVARKVTKSVNDNEYSIGILGTIAPQRRDYDVVLEALWRLKSQISSDVRVIFLGSNHTLESQRIVSKFHSSGFNIVACDGWLSEENFSKLGEMCDVLLAPLKFGIKEYGNGGSTGAFGDALRFNTRLLIPAFADPILEFSALCFYYSDSQSLAEALIHQHGQKLGLTMDSASMSRFSTDKATREFENLVQL